ncbi:MAG: DUF4339 domain-containing protein [Verrucomicrobiota bacterium]
MPQTVSMSEWYYAKNNQQMGPVEEAELKKLVSEGSIQPADLVWKEGMADWQPYSQVFAAESSSSKPAPQTSVTSTAGGAATASSSSFGAPQSGTKAAEIGLKYDFGDYLCWGIAIALVPCLSLFGYIALMVLFFLEFVELKKAVEAGNVEESQYSKTHPVLLLLGLFCCSIVFYPLFMHWRNESKLFKPQPHAVWFAIVILLVSFGISLLLNGTSAFVEAMNEIQAQ